MPPGPGLGIRMRCLGVVLLFLLAGCAQPDTPQWTTIPPAEARFPVAELLPQRRLTTVERTTSSSLRSVQERHRFDSGLVLVEQTFTGSKLTDHAVQLLADRAEAEAWARTVTPTPVEFIGTEHLVPDRDRGEAWLITYTTAQPGQRCTAGRGYVALRGDSDDRGFTYDTVVTAVLCHRLSAPPPDMPPLFRRLRARG